MSHCVPNHNYFNFTYCLSYVDNICSVDKHRQQHQVALRNYIFTDAMRQHLLDVHTGRTPSCFHDNYCAKVSQRGGILQLCRVGFGPFADNETEV